MFCLRLRRLRRRKLCVSRLGAIRGAAEDYQNAIRMLTPRKNHSALTEVSSDAVSRGFGRTEEGHYAVGSILGLENVERFVFVISVLEKYSDQDCSRLLGCSR